MRAGRADALHAACANLRAKWHSTLIACVPSVSNRIPDAGSDPSFANESPHASSPFAQPSSTTSSGAETRAAVSAGVWSRIQQGTRQLVHPPTERGGKPEQHMTPSGAQQRGVPGQAIKTAQAPGRSGLGCRRERAVRKAALLGASAPGSDPPVPQTGDCQPQSITDPQLGAVANVAPCSLTPAQLGGGHVAKYPDSDSLDVSNRPSLNTGYRQLSLHTAASAQEAPNLQGPLEDSGERTHSATLLSEAYSENSRAPQSLLESFHSRSSVSAIAQTPSTSIPHLLQGCSSTSAVAITQTTALPSFSPYETLHRASSVNADMERLTSPITVTSQTSETYNCILSTRCSPLEIGVLDSTHGWLKVRAEMTAGGSIHASLAVAAPTREALHASIPELTSYLQSEGISLARLDVHAMFGDASASATAMEAQANCDTGSNRPPQPHAQSAFGSAEEGPVADHITGDGSSNETTRSALGVPSLNPGWKLGSGGLGGWLSICA